MCTGVTASLPMRMPARMSRMRKVPHARARVVTADPNLGVPCGKDQQAFVVGCLLVAPAAGRGRAVKVVGGAHRCDAMWTCTHQERDLRDVNARRCL